MSRGRYTLVSSGRVRHPMDSKKLFVRRVRQIKNQHVCEKDLCRRYIQIDTQKVIVSLSPSRSRTHTYTLLAHLFIYIFCTNISRTHIHLLHISLCTPFAQIFLAHLSRTLLHRGMQKVCSVGVYVCEKRKVCEKELCKRCVFLRDP